MKVGLSGPLFIFLMVIKPVKFIDYNQLKTAKEVLAELNKALAHNREVALSLTAEDMRQPETQEWFRVQLDWIKSLYARAERLTYDGK